MRELFHFERIQVRHKRTQRKSRVSAHTIFQ